MYLTAPQLADLIDCAPNSFACMRRWLDRNNWPYAVGLTGFPKVSKTYHDTRLSSTAPTVQAEQEPNYGAFK